MFFPRRTALLKRSAIRGNHLVCKQPAIIRPAAYLPRKSVSTISLVTFIRSFLP
jgi:hypothetical protein